MPESFDDRTLKLIQQLTKSNSEQLSKWRQIQGKIAVVVSSASIDIINSRLALAMSVNCLSRLSPVITNVDIVVPESIACRTIAPLFDGQDLRSCIGTFIEKLKPDVEIRIVNQLEVDNYDAILSIGSTPYDHPFKISISSDGWIAFVSPNFLCKESTDNVNPIGAYVAANLGCAEIFKKIFVQKADAIMPMKTEYDFRWYIRFLKKELAFNTFEYEIDKKESANPPLPAVVDVGQLTVVGVGAGGGSCLYALASLPNLTGVFNLVDPDEVKTSNLNRYVYAIRSDAECKRSKVHIIEQILSLHKQCGIFPHYTNYADFSKQSGTLDLVISTVDTGKTRIAIQWDLPKTILDAAVMNAQFYVDTVNLGKNACLGCRFWQNGSSDTIEVNLSKIIGLSADIIMDMRANNSLIDKPLIEIMKPFSEKYNFQLPKEGERFQDWLLYHCAELHIDEQMNIPIPLPFAAIMPGVLLAGEVIKHRYFNAIQTHNFFSYDIFGISTEPFYTLAKKDNCPICSSKITIQRFKEKHNIKDHEE